MKVKVMYENYCDACDTAVVTDIPDHVCPACGEWMRHFSFITCPHCGERVYVDHFTNFCDCGAMYNAFGQELAPVEQWNPEDRDALYM